MPRGYKMPKTLAKIEAREYVRQYVTARLPPLLDGQLAAAAGLKYLVTRDKKTGKFIRVGPAMASTLGEETIEVWEKDPSTPATAVLLDRALDRPKEQEQELIVTGDAHRLALLLAGRQRAREGR